MSVPSCCFKGFKWNGQPTGRVGKLGNNNAYITGNNPDVAILYVHDLLGWTFTNARLLADHFAEEANVTVYLPDFFGGEVAPIDLVLAGKFDAFDLPGYMSRNTREIREPEIFECARALRKQYKTVGQVGYCYGGWAGFRLGAKEHNPPLVDFISVGHPSLLKEKDVEEVAVPVQLLAPEHDFMFSPEMKSFTFETLEKVKVPFDYLAFPGVEHGCFTRGDENVPGEREAMVRAKDASVHWFKQFSPVA